MSRGTGADCVALRFYLPPEDLRPFVTTIYLMEISGADDCLPVEDRLHPEWANLRLIPDGSISAAIGNTELEQVARVVMTGPTSHATRFVARPGRSWGIGLLPLGWTRLTSAPASDYADRHVDVLKEPALTRLRLLDAVFEQQGEDPARHRDRLVDALRAALGPPGQRDQEVIRLERALVDPLIHTVAELAAESGLSIRSTERLCLTAFGFPPQMLLRRQRFLRSLAQFMLDPSLKWIETLDSHYHDQAHFVRDFKRFMGMSPSEYARLPHPVLGAAAHARKAVAGEAVQVLHKPPTT
ncbi:helix-turn-helix domain-containing protein [Qipengyuania sp. RANM35]|uniref:helix-turn-helix domain-containing protein n=1 Tax=Qipengyuania sp. RANM35 TaxID=3068635 RepID=UPI0034DAFEC4